MLITKRLLLLLPMLALLSSCSEDFEVAAPYKPITVIYGILNTGDTAQYIRIQKAFLDENKSALVMAKDADSNFYPALSVHLKEINDAGAVVHDETLQRVDLNQEGFAKDSGAFFNNVNYAYKTTRFMDPAYKYRLVVTNAATGEVDSAETGVITNKSPGFFVYDFNGGFVLTFPAATANTTFSLTIKTPPLAQLFEGIIRFHYAEKQPSGTETNHTVDWKFATIEKSAANQIISVPQSSFYPALRDLIGPAPANVVRYLDSADVFIWAGSSDYATYQKINGAQGGLTADQIKPLYTNIKSNAIGNPIGLFTTRAVIAAKGVRITDVTIDSLRGKPVTQPLNFQKR